jgi:hypothetical protein
MLLAFSPNTFQGFKRNLRALQILMAIRRRLGTNKTTLKLP